MYICRILSKEDKPGLTKTYQTYYKERFYYKFPRRWLWMHRMNPFKERESIKIWIAYDDEENAVLGQTGTMIEPLKVGSDVIKMGWSVDTFLLPEFRGKGLGFQLQELNKGDNDIFGSFVMSNKNRRIKESLNATTLNPVFDMHLYIEQPAIPMLEHIFFILHSYIHPSSRIKAMCLKFLGWFLNPKSKLSKLTHSNKDIAMERVSLDNLGAIDDIYASFKDRYECMIERSSKYIKWKHIDQPYNQNELYYLKLSQQYIGYVVLRHCHESKSKVGLIVDFICTNNVKEIIKGLYILAIDLLKRKGSKVIEVATIESDHIKILIGLGFKVGGKIFPLVNVKDPEVLKKLQKSFYLSIGDQDWNQFPYTGSL